jgi:Fe-S-cluster containining protein
VHRDIEELYRDIDKLAEHLCLIHAERMQCRHGCSACCVDDITVYEVEAQYILRHYPDLLKTGIPHPAGACAFLDGAGVCRIYASRPYVCRTQGLPLRWIEELPEGRIVEIRDICPLNDTGELIENLAPEKCWEIGPFEERLARLQFAADGGEMRRVALRTLIKSHYKIHAAVRS